MINYFKNLFKRPKVVSRPAAPARIGRRHADYRIADYPLDNTMVQYDALVDDGLHDTLGRTRYYEDTGTICSGITSNIK